MKVLVTGATGQLGYDAANELLRRGMDVVGTGRAPSYEAPFPYAPMDVTDRAGVRAIMESVKPDAVIHCAAWTAVDRAEEEELRDTVYAVNVTGTGYLARAASEYGAKMLYISTDYVFDGEGKKPRRPDCRDFAPLNYYGETKLAGEQAVTDASDRYFIVHISWVFGKNGGNFVKTMLKLADKYDTLRVVNDQIGTPTYTKDLARLLADMIVTDRYGFYHASNEGGYISWYDFASEILRQAGKSAAVHPVTTEEYGVSAAKRPFNSRLDKAKLREAGFGPLPHWKDALARYLEEIKE